MTLSLDDKLLFFTILRGYFILKLFCFMSPYYSLKARFYL